MIRKYCRTSYQELGRRNNYEVFSLRKECKEFPLCLIICSLIIYVSYIRCVNKLLIGIWRIRDVAA